MGARPSAGRCDDAACLRLRPFVGAALGALVAWSRLSGAPFAGALGQAYAALFRGLPELLVVYFVYFGTSTLLTMAANAVGYEGFVGVPSFAAGALAVGVISGAYQAEVFRGAYLAIARGEIEAAVSVGMTAFSCSGASSPRRSCASRCPDSAIYGRWRSRIPRSSRSPASAELMRVSQIGAGSTHRPFAFYLGGAALYLVMTLLSNRLFDMAEARATRGMRRAAG